MTVSRPAVLFAAMMASRSDTLPSAPLLALSCVMLKPVPRPVSLLSAVVSTTSVASTPCHCDCRLAPKATADSTCPTFCSSTQSPPRASAPVRSSLAATSAPVSKDKSERSCRPASSAARSQPYSSRSPSLVKACDHPTMSPARSDRLSASSTVAPSCKAPAWPWLKTCTASRSLCAPSQSLTCEMPSALGSSRTMSSTRPSASACCRSKAIRPSASSMPASTKATSWRVPLACVPDVVVVEVVA